MSIENIKHLGLDGFVWWVGIVESRSDPLKLGRCQIRIYNWHEESGQKVKSKELFWASYIAPLNGSVLVSPPKPGDMVTGYYMDGDDAQFPIMTGLVVGVPRKENAEKAKEKTKKGFVDQRTEEELKKEPRPPKKKTFDLDGTGVKIEERKKAHNYPMEEDDEEFKDQKYPNVEYVSIVDEPTTPRLARNEKKTNEIKRSFINERYFHRLNTVPIVTRTKADKFWEEEKTKYDPTYPYNKVNESESGHLVEIDDTLGKERLHEVHRTGTFKEIYPDGTEVIKIVKDKYEIIMANNNVLVMGICNVSVMGDCNIFIKSDTNMRVDGNARIKIVKDLFLEVDGSMTTNVANDYILNIGGDSTTNIGGNKMLSVSGNNTVNVMKTLWTYVHKDIIQVSKELTNQFVGTELLIKSDGDSTYYAGSDMFHKASGHLYDYGTTIQHNSGGSVSVPSADDPPKAPEAPDEIIVGTPKDLEEAEEEVKVEK